MATSMVASAILLAAFTILPAASADSVNDQETITKTLTIDADSLDIPEGGDVDNTTVEGELTITDDGVDFYLTVEPPECIGPKPLAVCPEKFVIEEEEEF